MPTIIASGSTPPWAIDPPRNSNRPCVQATPRGPRPCSSSARWSRAERNGARPTRPEGGDRSPGPQKSTHAMGSGTTIVNRLDREVWDPREPHTAGSGSGAEEEEQAARVSKKPEGECANSKL